MPDRQSSVWQKALHGTFVAAILLAACYVVAWSVWGEMPVGAYGQPRSAKLPAGWSAPPWLLMLYLSALGSLLAAPHRPFVGVIAYLMVSFMLPVHAPSWIFTQWLGIRTIIAVLAMAGCVLWMYRPGASSWPRHDSVTIVLWAFVGWYAISAAAALVRDGYYSPPMQFHPMQLIDALAMYTIIVVSGDRDRALFVVALGLAAALAIRVTCVQQSFFRDADIASFMVIGVPLMFYPAACTRRWWRGVPWIAFGLVALWFVFHVQNRGAAMGLALAVFGAWATSRHRIVGLAVGLPILIGGAFWFLSTGFGERFLSVANWDVIWTNSRVTLWSAGVHMGWDHWLFGVGPGNFLGIVGHYDPRFAQYSSHNIVVDAFAEGGFVGATLYVALLGTVLVRCYRQARSDRCTASRFALMALLAYVGLGMFLSQTLLVLPYLLFAVSVTTQGSETADGDGQATLHRENRRDG